jgi:nitroreductase
MDIMKKTILTLGILGCMLAGCQSKQHEAVATQDENAVIATIMERRSIRKYKPQPVEREKMDLILRCGINAPIGQNKQSWEVRVVDNPTLMAEIQEAMAQGHPNMDPEMVKGCLRGAPTMVFIARAKSYDFSAYDCGLLAGNVMLAAQSLGVGSICLGSPVRFINDAENSAEILSLLGFSENYELSLCVGLGYANETPAAKPRDINKVQFVD